MSHVCGLECSCSCVSHICGFECSCSCVSHICGLDHADAAAVDAAMHPRRVWDGTAIDIEVYTGSVAGRPATETAQVSRGLQLQPLLRTLLQL